MVVSEKLLVMSEQEQTDRTFQTFGEWAYTAIAKHYDKSIKHEAKVLQDLDPEYLHQMRVGMRRLRSAISFFAPAIELPATFTAASVGKIAKVLGKLRDLDVLQETLTTKYQPYLPDSEQEDFTKALKKLDKQRKFALQKVVKTLNKKAYLKVKDDGQLWLDSPCYNSLAAINIQQVLPDLLLPEISNFLLHPAWLIGLIKTSNAIDFSLTNEIDTSTDISLEQSIALHELRKTAKKVRYNMELFQNVYSEVYSNYVQKIKELQDILGKIQDYTVLKQFFVEALKQDLVETMPALNQMLQENHQQQWQKWQTQQKYFLILIKRQDLRTIVQYPLTGE
jgi:CHAD domain-containing protein